MRATKPLAVLVLAALIAAACSNDDDAADTTTTTTRPANLLVVGIDAPQTPFVDYDDAGTVTGFEPEILTEITGRLGLEIEWVDTPADERVAGLTSGEFDAIASIIDVTTSPTDPVLFGDPIYVPQFALVINRALTPEIEGRADLVDGATIGVTSGSDAAAWAERSLKPDGATLVSFPAAADAFNALEAGLVTGVLAPERHAVEDAAQRTDLGIVELFDSDVAFGFGFSADRGDLVEATNKTLATMVADGTYQAIFDAWFVTPGGSIAASPDEPSGEVGNMQLILTTTEAGDPGANELSNLLNLWTGRGYSSVVAGSADEAVDAFCANPRTGVGFFPAHIALMAETECGGIIGMEAEAAGRNRDWSAFIVPRASDAAELQDLEGASWVAASLGDPVSYFIPRGVLAGFDLTPGSVRSSGSDADTVRAVYAGEADFGTITYLPPTNAIGEDLWDGLPLHAGVPDQLVAACTFDEALDLLTCGDDFIVNDARTLVRAELPDVVQQVRVLAATEGVPIGAVVFAAAVPPEIREGIMQGLTDTAANQQDTFGEIFGAYGWTNLTRPLGDQFIGLRSLLTAIGLIEPAASS